jgi:hypothetical protein
MAMSSGENTMVSLMIIESNFFKYGELATIMGVYANDGYMGSAGLFLNDSNYSMFLAKQDYTQKQYASGAYGAIGLFGSDDYDKDNITNEFDVNKTNFSLNYGHSFLEKFSFRASYSYSYVDYKANNLTVMMPQDCGYHNQINLSFSVSHNAGTGASLYVTFWRFRLPLGVNYTHNINDKDYLVSFVAGAGF